MEESKDKSASDWVEFIQDFTDKLTVKRILTALLAGFLITFTTLVYENRDAVFQKAYSMAAGTKEDPKDWVVSQKTKDDLSKLVKGNSLIKFALVTEVDLQKNRRVPLFWALEDQDETNIRFKSQSMLPQAVFDYDPKNTQQMVAVLNSEFVCSNFKDTVYQRLFPDLGKRMPTVCRLAIPPFYGRFVGILTIGLGTQPTKEELDSVRLEASRLAVEIYLRDVVKKSAPK